MDLTEYLKLKNISFDGLTVGGDLDLRGSGITSLPDGLTVGGDLDLRGSGITSLPDGLTVGGYLDLEGTGITSLPDGLTVGGDLDLRDTGITSLPDGLTVGGYLYLRDTGITSLPDGLTVGGYLDLEGTGITSKEINKFPVNYILKWHGKYIKADGIFARIKSKHKNIYRLQKIGKSKIIYMIIAEDGRISHGDTLDEAREDLIYKITNRDKSDFKNLSMDSILPHEEMIVCYRVVTGACAFGVKDFINSHNAQKKDQYSIKEIIDLTEGSFGHGDFQKFFSENRK